MEEWWRGGRGGDKKTNGELMERDEIMMSVSAWMSS